MKKHIWIFLRTSCCVGHDQCNRGKSFVSSGNRGKSCIFTDCIVRFLYLQLVVGMEVCHWVVSSFIFASNYNLIACMCIDTFLILKTEYNASIWELRFLCYDCGRTCCVCSKSYAMDGYIYPLCRASIKVLQLKYRCMLKNDRKIVLR